MLMQFTLGQAQVRASISLCNGPSSRRARISVQPIFCYFVAAWSRRKSSGIVVSSLVVLFVCVAVLVRQDGWIRWRSDL